MIKNRYLLMMKAACVVLIACFFLAFLYLIAINTVPGPYADYWDDIPRIRTFMRDGFNFYDLIVAHNNAHRISIPRLLFFVDYIHFDGMNYFLSTIGLLCKLLTLFLFNKILLPSCPANLKLPVNVIIAAALFNAANISNIIVSSNIQWDLMLVFSLLAVYFYASASRNPEKDIRITQYGLAYLFFMAGIFSQGGTLPVLAVFMLISAIEKQFRPLAFSIFFSGIFCYLHLLVWPMAQPEEPGSGSAILVLLMNPMLVCSYVFNFLSSPLIHYLGNHGWYFSFYLFSIFIICIYFLKRTNGIFNNYFIYASIFCILLMINIGAARVVFTPDSWGSLRYQPVSLIFILCLTLHGIFSAQKIFNETPAFVFRSILALHAIAIFMLIQFFTFSINLYFSNRILLFHSYMFAHNRNQYDGAGLILWTLPDNDVVKNNDAFFSEHAFAYYKNKAKTTGNEKKPLTSIGESLVGPDELNVFQSQCRNNTGNIRYELDANGIDLQLLMSFNTAENSLLKTSTFRNSYYILDEFGAVIGFGYPHLNRETGFYSTTLKAFVKSPTGKYVAETDNGKVVCLYSLAGN